MPKLTHGNTVMADRGFSVDEMLGFIGAMFGNTCLRQKFRTKITNFGYGGEIIPRPSSKNSKLSISLNQ